MRLSWLGVILQTESFTVQFPARAHAGVTGSVPQCGAGGNRLMFLSHIDVSCLLSPSLPLSLESIKEKQVKKTYILLHPKSMAQSSFPSPCSFPQGCPFACPSPQLQRPFFSLWNLFSEPTQLSWLTSTTSVTF